ncbi:prolyl oligopeptidase family serine peptidase [Sphingobium yanoikuyae]|uniref:Prolyl oligopeptidase family serine peptidase n=1 Tax=Sphingobium yanoikuyae TaxID=13690 RepID=A0AA42WR77_SPHYA|nr:prolyl oligopeptidase family serine peptidase [Sphingobium yanoikuyae]MDH2130165.1 prolyl oligopeptidase family serine peptidase [Sphingobium yanoikuyae]MDH2148090.1 prolyl oligopeptidase family serine peptidase [Sphingobium yanoikuyae]MDH2165686.1 prolyl oligopeptidase family serine peptidase [Sphingobium yanoikuyae]
MKRFLTMVSAALLTGAGAPAPAPADDPFVWLEDWTGPRAMQWVEAENKATVATLQGDPRYAGYYRQALAIASAKDRIAMPMLIHGRIYNFWRDADHPQGVWRYTSEADYASASPSWTTVLDLDALSRAEGRKWVWKGATILDPEERIALLALSDGGEDAVRLREFDLVDGRFVPGGFDIPNAKQNAEWLDKDTLLLSRDWGADSLTKSGYPFVIKTLKRGQRLEDAQEVFRGAASDQLMSMPILLSDGQGNRAAFLFRGVTFFGNETWLLTAQGTKRLALPAKSQLQGMVDGQVLIQTSEEWTSGGVTVPAGALASVALKALQDGGVLTPEILFAPTPRQSIDGVVATQNRVVLSLNDNVRGRVRVYARGAKGWAAQPVELPDNATISTVAASDKSDKTYLAVAGFLAPTTLWAMDAAEPKPVQVKAMPARFDAAGLVVEQFEATSSDGTKIPYFIVHKKGMTPDGSTPAIMTAYGGFEVPMTPSYAAITGKLWLERGNSFVLANIRGGGEFGPAWHEAGLKTKRQIIYDDFAAVAQDIFARKLSSPRKFGIYGGSNGGLLMGVEFNQHPDLWNGVVIQVPLLDMIRYEQIAAGASWVDEYGSVSVPEEKAFLETISPYANIRKGVAYPTPYIWTTTKDDRVGPQHARKFAARLKDYGLPYLFYEDTAGGHSGDADIEQGARLQAMQMVYFSQRLEGK